MFLCHVKSVRINHVFAEQPNWTIPFISSHNAAQIDLQVHPHPGAADRLVYRGHHQEENRAHRPCRCREHGAEEAEYTRHTIHG